MTMLVLGLTVLISALMIVIGGFIFNQINDRYPFCISVLVGLSSGFLIALIFEGLLAEANELISEFFSEFVVRVMIATCTLVGVALLFFAERIFPEGHHEHTHGLENNSQDHRNQITTITLVAFGLHSIFEYLSLIIAGVSDLRMGVILGVILGIHNIPIGFIIMTQLRGANVDRETVYRGMVILSFVEMGISILIFLLISAFVTELIQGILLSVTAGMMLYLVFDELLPKIYDAEDRHRGILAALLGVVVMSAIIV